MWHRTSLFGSCCSLIRLQTIQQIRLVLSHDSGWPVTRWCACRTLCGAVVSTTRYPQTHAAAVGWRRTCRLVMMPCSVELSSADVASSQMSRRGSRRKARAMATRCFSPPESFRPRSPTLVSKPCGMRSIAESSLANRAAVFTCTPRNLAELLHSAVKRAAHSASSLLSSLLSHENSDAGHQERPWQGEGGSARLHHDECMH